MICEVSREKLLILVMFGRTEVQESSRNFMISGVGASGISKNQDILREVSSMVSRPKTSPDFWTDLKKIRKALKSLLGEASAY